MFPCSLILWPKPCFCYLMRKFAFLWGKIIIHKQQCTRMCRGVACKPGRQESVISKASLHADHPPMCLKLLCKCTMIWYCNASLYKKVRHYFCHDFVLTTGMKVPWMVFKTTDWKTLLQKKVNKWLKWHLWWKLWVSRNSCTLFSWHRTQFLYAIFHCRIGVFINERWRVENRMKSERKKEHTE